MHPETKKLTTYRRWVRISLADHQSNQSILSQLDTTARLLPGTQK